MLSVLGPWFLGHSPSLVQAVRGPVRADAVCVMDERTEDEGTDQEPKAQEPRTTIIAKHRHA